MLFSTKNDNKIIPKSTAKCLVVWAMLLYSICSEDACRALYINRIEPKTLSLPNTNPDLFIKTVSATLMSCYLLPVSIQII
jgi:hypothetical protein